MDGLTAARIPEATSISSDRLLIVSILSPVRKEALKRCLLCFPYDVIASRCADPKAIMEPDGGDSKASLLNFL